MIKRALVYSTMIVWCSAASAQDVKKLTDDDRYDTCVRLAEVVAANTSKKYEKATKDIIHMANICSVEWGNATRNQKIGIKAWYESLTGVFDASDDKVENFQKSSCQSNYGKWWDDKLKTEEQRTISKDGADVVTTCLQNC